MKTKRLLIVTISLISSSIFNSCSGDFNEETQNQISIEANSKVDIDLTAPNGMKIAESERDLSQKLSEKKIKILALSYVSTPKDYTGFAAEITYEENNTIEHIALVNELSKIKFNTEVITIIDADKKVTSQAYKIKCSGSGCCTMNSHLDVGDAVITYDCFCEGNSEGNSGCSITITQV